MRTEAVAKIKRLIKAAFPVVALAAFLFLLFVALTRAQDTGTITRNVSLGAKPVVHAVKQIKFPGE